MAKLNVGDRAPDFTLPDQEGNPVKLSDFKGKRVVLYFYPKDDTPGCTAQACGFRDEYPAIADANAVVLGVSRDGKTSHQRFRDKFGLPFPLLSDELHEVAELYGVWGKRKFAGREYMGIVRSHFVVGPDGRLEDAQVDVSPKDSVSRALESLRG